MSKPRVDRRQRSVLNAFSSKADDYSAARPDYPAALYQTLVDSCNLTPDSVIVDLGAGTGLLTQGFLKRGLQAIAVEPNADMRMVCDELLSDFPTFRSIEGTAEAIPLDDSTVDLVAAAQAFHWFDVEKSRSECLRILKPTGNVAIIWNKRVSRDGLNEELDKIFDEFGGTKRPALVAREKSKNVKVFFGKVVPHVYRWPHRHQLGEAGLVSLVLSRSYMPKRETAAAKEIVLQVQRIFRQFASSGLVTIRYLTVARVGRPVA